MNSSNTRLPRSLSDVARLDPEFAAFVEAEYEALHAFAVRICERFGFSCVDADKLCDQATLLGMMDRSLSKSVRDEATRAWKSTLLNWVSAEL